MLVALLTLMVAAVVAADEPASVTFYGFQMFADGSSRIFVHLTKKPPLLSQQDGLKAVYTMSDSRILIRNNKNPLNLEHFPTPAKRATLVARDGDVELVVELKSEVALSHRFADNPDGTVSLHIDLPRPGGE